MDFTALETQLKKRRFLPHVFETAAEAKTFVLELIGSRSVGIGGSATVRDMGLYDALAAKGCDVHWHWMAEKPEKQRERDLALKAEVYLSSSNAVLNDGRIVNIEGTGNRVTGLIYGPPVVVVIMGRNKVAADLDSGIQRIKRDCCPANARRLGHDTPCARTNECADCRTAARMCNVVTIHEAPTRAVKEFHVVLINEDLGL